MIAETRNLELWKDGEQFDEFIGYIIGWSEWNGGYSTEYHVEPIVFVDREGCSRLIDISSGDYRIEGWPGEDKE